jgi:hypothetical protein
MVRPISSGFKLGLTPPKREDEMSSSTLAQLNSAANGYAKLQPSNERATGRCRGSVQRSAQDKCH